MHLQRNATQRNATQRNATQRNATQRNANHNYILNNNFKFYIYQFFRAFSFLSVSFLSFIKESKSSYFFEWQKSKHAKGGQSSKTISFFVKKRNKKTTPFRIHNSVFMGLLQFIENQFAIISHYEGNARSNLFSGLLHSPTAGFSLVRNDKFKISNDGLKICNDNFNYAFSGALKNKFEIISQLNYGFCYKNYFFNLNQVFRNSYDFGERLGRNLNYGFGKDYNCNFKNNCDYSFEKNYNFGFGKNYFGNCNFGYGFWK